MELNFKNLIQMQRHFNTELVCAQYLEEQRWEGKPVCPHCGSANHGRTQTRLKHVELKGYRDFRCKDCDKKYSVLTGTIFESSKIDLKLWFAAMYILSAHKKGISSLQLHRDLGITQKSAWFMLHRLREVFAEDTEIDSFGSNDVVEIDESFIGGKNKNRHKHKKVKNSQGRSFKDKTPVLGILERDGKIKALPIPDTAKETIEPIIEELVMSGAKIVTDEWKAYTGLTSKYDHKVISHSQKEFVNETDKSIHCNTIEGFWSILKRGIIGIYHYTSRKHLHRYCDEFAYRYNTRKETDVDRFIATIGKVEGRLRYADLVKGK